jgi:hypothetical protein
MSASTAIQSFANYVAANPASDEETAIGALVAGGISQSLAEDVVRFTAVAFGRLILQEMDVELSNDYILFAADGSEREAGALRDKQAYRVAEDYAKEFAAHPSFRAIARTSPEYDAVNQALQAGSDPKDLVMGPVAMFAEPPTAAGVEAVQRRVTELARQAAGMTASDDHQPQNRPWWKFW